MGRDSQRYSTVLFDQWSIRLLLVVRFHGGRTNHHTFLYTSLFAQKEQQERKQTIKSNSNSLTFADCKLYFCHDFAPKMSQVLML